MTNRSPPVNTSTTYKPYRTPILARGRPYFNEFPPQRKFCPYRGNFESCRFDVGVTRPCRSSTLWREKVSRYRSPISAITDPFAESLRRYSSDRRHGDPSSHLLRKLLVYAKTSSKSYSTRTFRVRVPIKKSQSLHKEKQMTVNRNPHNTRDEALQSMYRTKSCKNVERVVSRRASPTEQRSKMRNVDEKAAKMHHASIGAGRERPTPEWSTTYDYLRNSSRSVYLPEGVFNRTTEVHYLDDVTRCVKHAIRMLIDDDKPTESCPMIASRYMQHIMEYHHKDAQAQVNFQQDCMGSKLSKETWTPFTSSYSGSTMHVNPCHPEPTKPLIDSPYGSKHRECYFPNTKNNDRILSDKSIAAIVEDWMRGIPLSARFTVADKMQRERTAMELSNCISSLLTEPKVARKVVLNYMSDLPMWLPEGEAQIKFKNQIADNLMTRLTEAGRIVVETKNVIFGWVKNIEYEPRDEDGEIVTDCKIVNNISNRLEPLIINRPESESIYKAKMQTEIFEEVLNIPLSVQDDMKCVVKINLADDLLARLLCLNAGFKTNDSSQTSSDPKSDSESIRNVICDWMKNIPVNPHFSQLDLELQERWIDDLTDELIKLDANRNFRTTGKDAIVKSLKNLPMWWPGEDAIDGLIDDLADKLIDTLAGFKCSVEIKNIISNWAKNISTDDDITTKIFDKLQPLILNRKQLEKGQYKRQLKTVICDELRKTPIDLKHKNKSIAVMNLAEKLTKQLISLDSTQFREETDSQIRPSNYLLSIVKEWIKGIPFNDKLSLEDRDNTIEDLALKLSELENDVSFESKAKIATVNQLNDLPVMNPDDKAMVEFTNEKASELVKKLEIANSLISKLKNTVSEWVMNIDYKTTDDDGQFVTNDVITNRIVESLQYTVLNRPKDDKDYRIKLERNILDVIKKVPLKCELVSGLATDLVENFVNIDQVQPVTAEEKDKWSDSKTSGIQKIVNDWMQSLPVSHDFDSKEKQARDQIAQNLVIQIALARNDNNLDSDVKEAALQFLKSIPIRTPNNHEKDKIMIDLSNKLYDRIRNFLEIEEKLQRLTFEWAACVPVNHIDDNGNQFTKADVIESVVKRIRHAVLSRPKSDNEYKDQLIEAITEELLKFPFDVNFEDKNRLIRKLSEGLTEKLISFHVDDPPIRKSVTKVSSSVMNDTVCNFNVDATSNTEGQKFKISEQHKSGFNQKLYARNAYKRQYSDTENRKRRKANASDSGESRDSSIDIYNSYKNDTRKSRNPKCAKMRKNSSRYSSPTISCDLNRVDCKLFSNDTGRKSSKSESDSDSKKSCESRRDQRKSDIGKRLPRDLKNKKRCESCAHDSSVDNRASLENIERCSVSKIEKLEANIKKGNSRTEEKSDYTKSRKNENEITGNAIGTQRESRLKDKIKRNVRGINLNNSKIREWCNTRLSSTENLSKYTFKNDIRLSKSSKPYSVPSEPMADGEIEKKVLEVLKDSSMFERLSLQEGINVIKGITEKLNEFTTFASVKLDNFIDDAVSEWMEVLEEKTIENHFKEEIFNCFAICPQTSEAVHKKANEVLVSKLASNLAECVVKGVHDKEHEENNIEEITNIVNNIFTNENIDVKHKYESANKIYDAIINVIKQREIKKGNLKEIFRSVIIQWMKSILEISKTACQPEYKRCTRKLVNDLLILATTETIDSEITNRMQEKITLFLETILQNENVVIERRIKKRYIAKLLNHVLYVIKLTKKTSENLNKLKSEISYWLFESPLFKNASRCDRNENVKNPNQARFGVHENGVDIRQQDLVQDLVTEFINETIEKSHRRVPVEIKSILANELLEKLTVKECNMKYDKNKNKQSKNIPKVSFNIDAVKSILEEVIKNYFYLKSDFNKSEPTTHKNAGTLYNDMTNTFAEILEKKYLLASGKTKQDIQEDIPEYIRSFFRKRGSPIDYSVVQDITSKLIADLNGNLKTKQNKILKKYPSHIKTQIQIQPDYEDADLSNLFDSIEEKLNDYNVSLARKRWKNDLIFEDETSDEDNSKTKKGCKNRVVLRKGHVEIQCICNTSPFRYKTYGHNQNGEKNTKEKEHSEQSRSPNRSTTDQDGNRDYRSPSNKPTTSYRCSMNENGISSKQGQNFSHPPSTSQSSEDLTRNTYSLRKHSMKSDSPVRRDPSSPDMSDNSSVDEENIMSVLKRHIMDPSLNKEPDLPNLIDVSNLASNLRTKPRHLQAHIYNARIEETNRQHPLQNENYGHRNKTPVRKKENGPHTTMIDIGPNHLHPSTNSSIKNGIVEILMKRVGLNRSEASEFADILIKKTRSLYEQKNDATTKVSETMINTLKDEIKGVLKSFDIDYILEETELSILNILTNQVMHGNVNDRSLRTSLMNILVEVNENIAEDVADTLLDHVKNISFEPMSARRKHKEQEKYNTKRQYMTAVSLTPDDKHTYVDLLNKDIKEFVLERIPSRTSSASAIVDRAIDELIKIFQDTMENSKLTIEEQQSVIRRETDRFLSTIPIKTKESNDELVDKIVEKLHHSYAISRGPRFSMTQSQKDAFLSDTKKILGEICEDNDVDMSLAKTHTQNLIDSLNEMIANKSLKDFEKWEHLKKEFNQYFRSLLPQSGSLPDKLVSQVIDKVPDILKNSLALTNLPNQKELLEIIMDFIKEKTGDMTPRSQQQLQAQIEEVIAETISILEDSNVTVTEKAGMIKYGFARFLNEIPRQSGSNSIDELALELYDRLFRSRATTTTSMTLSISSDQELIKIMDNEKRYFSQLMNIIRNWSDQASLITDEISDPKLKDAMAGDLAKDIIDKKKYIQLNTGAKSSDEDELEYLKYQVFRWLNKKFDVNDLSPFVGNIEELMKEIRRMPVCVLVKPSNKTLEDEITKWMEKVPYNKAAPKHHLKEIRDLADKIQRHRGNPLTDSKIDNDISQFVSNIFHEDNTTLKSLGIQLRAYLKHQGLLRDHNARAYKTGAEDLFELVEDWCRDLPIYLGDSPEEQKRAKTIEQSIASKLMNKLGELNMNPQILNDDFLYEDLLLDEVDNLLYRVPRNPELEKYLPALKRELMSRVKGARQKIRDEQAAHVYKQQLRDTITLATSIPEPLFQDELISFEILRDNLVDAFINLHYVTDNDQEELKFKRKISDEINRFCNDYLRRHPCTPIDSKTLAKQLYRALQAVPIPTDDSLRPEIEQIKIKEILLEWARELPLKEETGTELLQRNKTLAMLARRLREIEKEKYSNICFDSDGKIREEISKWLRRNNLKVGHDSEIPRAIDRIVDKLKRTEHVRALEASKSWVDSCFCMPSKPMIPPCTLSAEDRSHLKRIREKYNTTCQQKYSLSIENSCQTIEPWCPNRSEQDRIPTCSSNQPSAQVPWYPNQSVVDSIPAYSSNQPSAQIPWCLNRSEQDKIPTCSSNRPSAQVPWCPNQNVLDRIPNCSSNQPSAQVPWCPNRSVPDRIPTCPSNQPPNPYPNMNTSASPCDMHQCPHVIVKDYVWDSTDSKMSGMQETPIPCRSGPPCVQKQPSTDVRFPKCTSVSSQIGPDINHGMEPVICPRSPAFKCSQGTQARHNAAVACSTPKVFDYPDSDEEDRSSEDNNILPCRPKISSRICEEPFRLCKPPGALYSSFLPKKDKSKPKKKRPVYECSRPLQEDHFKNPACYRPSSERCDKERRQKSGVCVCQGKKGTRKGYRAAKFTEEETSGNSGAECPYPSYMYFRD